jgi:hypothetical protein
VSRLAALLALLAVLGAPAAVLGQESAPEAAEAVPEPPDLPPGEDRIEHLTLRAPAPFEGMLLDMDTSLRWTFALEWYRHELGLTIRTHRRELAALDASHERELTIVRESYEREIEGLRGDLRDQATTFAQAQAHEHPWYDTFVFGSIVGVVLSGVLVGLTAWAAAEL